MTTSTTAPSVGFYRLAVATLVVGALLIWVGAAVTTTGSGMAFSDWPLSNGSVNPRGWLYVPPQLLEHGHRLLATCVGFMVLGMFFWLWRREGRPLIVAFALVIAFIVIVIAVHKADKLVFLEEDTGANQTSFPSPTMLWLLAGITVGAVFWWLINGLRSGKWPLLLKLTAAALVTVVSQAVLGGLRVLEVSDPLGIAHGCLGQLFYCLLIAVALHSSRFWGEGAPPVPDSRQRRLLFLAALLFFAVVVQLLLGATVRHTQRAGLAAADVLTTAGYLVPPMAPLDVFTIFLHKAWGVLVFFLALLTGHRAGRAWHRQHTWVTFLPRLLLFLPLVQVTLGVFVVHTRKSFWVTNFHVLNGLFILGTSFLVLITAWRSHPLTAVAHDAERRHPSA